MKKVVVTAKGLHLHERSSHKSVITDSLTTGDLLEVMEIGRVGWLHVRVLKIANARYSESREGATGWVYGKGTVMDVEDEPVPFPVSEPGTNWLLWSIFVAAAMAAIVAVRYFFP